MKKLFAILVSVMMVVAASAQHRGGGHYGGGHYYRPQTRVIVGVGGGYYSPYYSPYSYPYGYGYWNRPYYRPSGLQLKIEDIEADYQDRIYSVRHDKSIPRSERKTRIHQLKSDRDQAIRNAERSYYNSY